nr:hypothetical protein Iba_chr13fCG6160 [Ipomoea batatas]
MAGSFGEAPLSSSFSRGKQQLEGTATNRAVAAGLDATVHRRWFLPAAMTFRSRPHLHLSCLSRSTPRGSSG